MKKAFVIEDAEKAEELRAQGFAVEECNKNSVQVAQALILAFLLDLAPEDEGVFFCTDIEFVDSLWLKQVLRSLDLQNLTTSGF